MDKLKVISDTIKARQAAAARIRFERVCSVGSREAIKKLLKSKGLTFIISARGSGRSYYMKQLENMRSLYGSAFGREHDRYLFDLRE